MKKCMALVFIILILNSFFIYESSSKIEILRVPPFPGKVGKDIQENPGKINIVENKQSYLYSLSEEMRKYYSNKITTTGTDRIIIIRVEFQTDSDPSTTGNGRWNSYTFYNFLPDFKNYYSEVSYGKLNIEYTLTEIYTLNHQMSYYGGGDIEGFVDLVRDAVTAADPDYDFSQYDGVGILHAGVGEETDVYNDSPNDIWSVYIYGGTIVTADGVNIDNALIVPETENQDSVTASPLGTTCHEFGHMLGLPDLYNTSSGGKVIGRWGLMDAGNWNANGYSPSHPCAWSKIKLGWVDPILVTSKAETYPIKNVELNQEIYKMPIDDNEYFLIENRYQTGFDSGLPGSGILIWHIDETQNDNNGGIKMVALEERDHNNNPKEEKDAWFNTPSGFTDTSTPNSRSNSGEYTGIEVTMISDYGEIMTCNFEEVNMGPQSIHISSPSGGEVYGEVEFTLEDTDFPDTDIVDMELQYYDTEWHNCILVTSSYPKITWDSRELSDGTYNFRVELTDEDGHVYYTPEVTLTVHNSGPKIVNITVDPDPCCWDPTVECTAESNSTITDAEFYVDLTGDPISLNPKDGFFDSNTEDLNGTVPLDGLYDGEHTLYLHAFAGEWGPFSHKKFTVDGIKNVSVTVNETSATITWDTEFLSNSIVRYGDIGSMIEVSDPDPVLNHSITLTDLEAKTYYFEIESVGDITRKDNNNGDYFSFTVDTVTMEIHLKKGWNLIGWPLEDEDVDKAVSTLKDEDFNSWIFRFDPLTQRYQWHDCEGEKQFQDFETGRGYWIYCYNDVIWVIQ